MLFLPSSLSYFEITSLLVALLFTGYFLARIASFLPIFMLVLYHLFKLPDSMGKLMSFLATRLSYSCSRYFYFFSEDLALAVPSLLFSGLSKEVKFLSFNYACISFYSDYILFNCVSSLDITYENIYSPCVLFVLRLSCFCYSSLRMTSFLLAFRIYLSFTLKSL